MAVQVKISKHLSIKLYIFSIQSILTYLKVAKMTSHTDNFLGYPFWLTNYVNNSSSKVNFRHFSFYSQIKCWLSELELTKCLSKKQTWKILIRLQSDRGLLWLSRRNFRSLKLVSHWDASNLRLFETNLRHVLATEMRHCNHNHIAVSPNR